jgi:16S rRNA (guanine(527)-N(7))-methyltransferase RsmG
MHRRFQKPSKGQPPRPRRSQGKPSSEKPTKDGLDKKLKRAGIELSSHQLDQLWRYHNLLRERNQDRELTRLIGFDTIVTKHYVDCMIVGEHFKLPTPLLDIGTGPGFPGIPLKIRYPHLHIILGEPRPKRIAFLREACRVAKLQNWEIFDRKIVSRSFQRRVPGVITRAVETMDKTCMRTSACLGEGGLLVFMKGPGVDPELAEIKSRFGKQFRVKLDKAYQLPHTNYDRRLIVLEKLVPPVVPKEAPHSDEEEAEDVAPEAEDSDL